MSVVIMASTPKRDSLSNFVPKAGPQLTVVNCQPGQMRFVAQQPHDSSANLETRVQEGGTFGCRCGNLCGCGRCGGKLGVWCC
ncbi:hypothetical protein RvY_18866 [Ramazzottius varieornatus]|uniref:Uncharacterized protein n=1 Tax=Ramazzottius varieornatus TaxID=947166 RepID=A0A1D1WBV2_RAMVA|nr:hypothetical protein RvY_18866 [Ramazzottius varieornatus]